MGNLKVAVVALLLVFLTLVFIALQFGVAINMTFTKTNFYHTIFTRQQFYLQLRQALLKLVNNNLPNGQESLPFLDKVLTVDWLQQVIPEFINNIFAFLKGDTTDLPIIPFDKLVKDLADAIDLEIPEQAKYKLIRYWFPTYEQIRIQDFAPTEPLWAIRRVYAYIGYLPWVVLGLTFLFFLLLYAITRKLASAILWCGASMLASGVITIVVGMILNWALDYTSLISSGLGSVVTQIISQENIVALFQAAISGFVKRLNILAFISLLLGSAMVHFAPVDKPKLTLVK